MGVLSLEGSPEASGRVRLRRKSVPPPVRQPPPSESSPRLPRRSGILFWLSSAHLKASGRQFPHFAVDFTATRKSLTPNVFWRTM